MRTVSIVATNWFGPVRPGPLEGGSLADCVRQLVLLPRQERFHECSCPDAPPFLRGRVGAILRMLSSNHVEISSGDEADLLSAAAGHDGQWSRWSRLRLLDRAARLGRPLPRDAGAAMSDPAFHRTACEAGLDLGPLAARMAGSGGDADRLLEEWHGLPFSRRAVNGFAEGSDPGHLSSILRRVAGGRHGGHMFNFGACGLFARTLDRVLGAGGDYVVLAGSGFDPEGDRACHHVALRVGNWVVDGLGVSRLGPFLAHWGGIFEDMHEVRAPSPGGFLEAMRPRGEGLLDAAALGRDLVSLGAGPGMVEKTRRAGPAVPGSPARPNRVRDLTCRASARPPSLPPGRVPCGCR